MTFSWCENQLVAESRLELRIAGKALLTHEVTENKSSLLFSGQLNSFFLL